METLELKKKRKPRRITGSRESLHSDEELEFNLEVEKMKTES
jgi:hypothetical protein